LGEITKNKFTIAVAGTHGKTTITSMIAHIFVTAGVKVAAFVGGITKNYNSNFIGLADAEVIIVEADEYDRSFLSLSPDISLISSIDADHLDIYHSKDHLIDSFKLFAGRLMPNGTLIINLKVFKNLKGINCATYGLSQDADLFASEIEILDRAYHFNFISKDDSVNNLKFKIPGRHNLENIIAAVSVAKKYGIKNNFIKEALETYNGVIRRFDIIVNHKNQIYIDDYAHHPEEIKACIKAVREFYANQKITGVFQPHLFSRTRDFANEFARSLELLDELILLEIYPARELPIEGINSSYLLNKVNLEYKHLLTTKEVLDFVENSKPELLLTIGAGDIDKLVEPIKERMSD
jgi:UDP-N-acetylmuramate--alanine ligase